MKKKKTYITLIVTTVLLLLVYFGYYFLFLKDEGQNWRSSNPNVDLDGNNSVRLVVTEVKQDKIKYCILNDCTHTLLIPTTKMETNDFDGWGEYKVTFNFSKHLFYPWSEYTYLQSWSIEKVEEQANLTVDNYLESIKGLLQNYYAWEIYSLPTTPSLSREDVSLIQKSPILDWEYTKSLYLINQISENYNDSEFKEIFDKEISYLHDNVEQIIEGYEDSLIPPAYLLKLVDQGLTMEYLSIIEQSTVPQYFDESLEVKIEDRESKLITEGQPYSSDYQKIIRYADYYNIFTEYDKKDFADFSYNQMLVLSNNMESLNGICSLAYFGQNLIDSNELKNKLETVFSDETTQLIEGSLYELIMCKKYANTNDVEIVGLEQAIDNALDMSTSKIGEYFFIMRGVSTSGDNIEEIPTIKSFSLLDNLMYIWSEK